MSFRYLIGPVSSEWAEEFLHAQTTSGDCLTFDTAAQAALVLGPDEDWNAFLARMPSNWLPDVLFVCPHYRSLPPKLWSAPLPIVALAADWNLQWHAYRRFLRNCEMVLTDTLGVELCQREGISSAHAMNLFGLGRSWAGFVWPDSERDIDILFVGNFHPSVQHERMPLLAQIASLRPQWNVVLTSGIFGDDYRRLLARSRIVFNRGIRSEWNMRVGEAITAGALLFQEASNREVPLELRHGEECVFYEDDNLLSLLSHYLEHEEERKEIARKARIRQDAFTFQQIWDNQLTKVETELPLLRERARQRCTEQRAFDVRMRVWMQLSAPSGSDISLRHDLLHILHENPMDSTLQNAAGIVALNAIDILTPSARLIEAANAFQQACRRDPHDVVAGLNLAEVLVRMNQRENANEQAYRTLAMLDELDLIETNLLDAPHAGNGFDDFRVEWERIAWKHAGDTKSEIQAKLKLVRWRLHSILAELHDDLVHAFIATSLRPDLAVSTSALGHALARKNRMPEAAYYLRKAVAANPFDNDAARTLFEALRQMGRRAEQERFAQARRYLSDAAPTLVPAESWFVKNAPESSVVEQGGQSKRPDGTELASIVILCCNQLQFTQLCLESLLRTTRTPYELLMVDNGSSDGTTAYLDLLRARAGPERVEVIRNEENLGFAKGCNQALARAAGRYLILLNNDTVLTPHWLERLIAWSLHDWPHVGIVGPVTNYAAEPQQIAVPFTRLEDVDSFAERRHHDYARKAMYYPRLTGFCLLIRREVFEAMGSLDERFGIGFFEDDDVCVRARRSGYKLLLALNVYIHHFGSRTFADLGIDCEKQLRDNFALFREKWGEEHSAGYRFSNGDSRKPIQEPSRGASAEHGIGSGTTSAKFAGQQPHSHGTLAERYRLVCQTPSDINEHCPTLFALARECRHITEMGTRSGNSTTALLHAQPDRLVCYDRVRLSQVDELRSLSGRTSFVFREADVLEVEIEPTDLLFIDTWHVYEQLRQELQRHANKARKYIVLHDTTTFGEDGEFPGRRGLWPAVEEFISEGNFCLKTRYTNNNGLTVLERVTGAKYEAETSIAAPFSTSARPKVSLTMIVKNEESNLDACLQSVADLITEIIIVDTGSTDRTKEIAQRFGAKVFDFPWIDNFSAARNEALRHATGEWIFWMDADDRLDESNRVKLRELFAKLPNDNFGFVMKCLCLPDADTNTSTVVDHVRLFRNDPHVRWTFRIHEQILPAIRRQGGDVRWSDVTIHHVGYQNSAVRKGKLERDLRLLTMEQLDQPDNPFTNFNLASVYQEQGKVSEALVLFRRSLECSAPTDSIVRKLYAQIIQCQRQLQQSHAALATCDEAHRQYPHDLEILFQEALTKRDVGDRRGAIRCLEQVLEQRDTQHFASVDTGLHGYKTRHNLAVYLQEEGRTEEAERHWQQALHEQPNFVPALAGIAEIELKRCNWPVFDSILARLRQSGKGDMDAQTLQARKHLALQEFAEARQSVEHAIAAFPHAIWPRVLLTHVLLREAKDWRAAELALRDVLAIDPAHVEANRNLSILLQQHGKA